jgi:short-subunit dehydrogenase
MESSESETGSLTRPVSSRNPKTSFIALTPLPTDSTAKFAVKGFSESLLVDFRHNAPHIGVSVVMPGHVGSKIIQNSGQILGGHGVISGVEANAEFAKNFEESAPLTPAQAATIILDGVRAGKWRILVGKDAELFDRLVRENPESAYNEEFFDEIRKAGAGVNVTGVNTLDEKAK